MGRSVWMMKKLKELFVPELPQQYLTQPQETTLREELAGHIDEQFGVEHFVLAKSLISSCVC